jgi:hypothetical protein
LFPLLSYFSEHHQSFLRTAAGGAALDGGLDAVALGRGKRVERGLELGAEQATGDAIDQVGEESTEGDEGEVEVPPVTEP